MAFDEKLNDRIRESLAHHVLKVEENTCSGRHLLGIW